MEIAIIFGLILLNGLLSMSEIALVSARKTRLESAAKKGSYVAQKALDLAGEPDRFLPTIQIGITLVGILTGLFSAGNIPRMLAGWFYDLGLSPALADSLSYFLVILTVTYFSLVIGELVPKRIGMSHPESVSKMVAGPMFFFSKITAPFVWILSSGTTLFIRILKIDTRTDNRVTEEEIKAILQEGTQGGEIQEVEQDIVERVFHLSDRDVSSLMTHRNDLDWLDTRDNADTVIQKVMSRMHNVYPVATERIDNIEGVAFLKEMFGKVSTRDFCLKEYIRPAQYVPENMNAYDALSFFKQNRMHYALVSDEFGNIQGMVTLFDIMDAMVGDISETTDDEYRILEREDGSYLMDGQYSFFDFLAYFDLEDLFQEHDYNTVSGLILDVVQKIPSEGDQISWMGFHFEIIDMDGARIDKVLVKKSDS